MKIREPRYCSNCRAELPDRADSCPACGVFAGDVFDGKWPRRPAHTRFWLVILVLAIVAAAAAVWLDRRSRLPAVPEALDRVLPSTRVVADRPGGSRRAPGAKLTEAELVRLLRRHIVEVKGIRDDCLVLLGEEAGSANDTFGAFDRCASVRLGRWRVDPRTGQAGPVEIHGR